MKVTALDHVVINCGDVERSLRFYVDDLGLEPLRVLEWRRNEVPFPSVRIDRGTIIDLFDKAPTGENLNHFCLVVEPTDFEAVKASGRFEVRSGPGTRWGARGDATSLYISDPDGNTIELRYYE